MNFFDRIKDRGKVFESGLERDVVDGNSGREVEVVVNHLSLAFVALRQETTRVVQDRGESVSQRQFPNRNNRARISNSS